jgi:hypothetical protein
VVQHPPAVPVEVRQVAIPAPGVSPAVPEHTAPEKVSTEHAAVENIDAERIRAAVTLALDAALPKMIDEITERVLIALGH